MGDVTMQELEGTLDAALSEQVTRQENWLKRSRPDAENSDKCDWKPRKRHRKSAYQWLCCLHNQLKTYVHNGLLFFGPPNSEVSYSAWPRLSISPDMGSDGSQAFNKLLPHLF